LPAPHLAGGVVTVGLAGKAFTVTVTESLALSQPVPVLKVLTK